jgi:hypothetical protein
VCTGWPSTRYSATDYDRSNAELGDCGATAVNPTRFLVNTEAPVRRGIRCSERPVKRGQRQQALARISRLSGGGVESPQQSMKLQVPSAIAEVRRTRMNTGDSHISRRYRVSGIPNQWLGIPETPEHASGAHQFGARRPLGRPECAGSK